MAVISRETPQKKDSGLIFFFLRYVLIALAMSLAAFVVLALVYIFVDIPTNVLEIITLVISVAVSLIVSFLVGKETATAITGGCVTLIFALLRVILSVAFGFTPFLSIRIPFELVTGFLVGLLGGILGSSGGKRRRYR